MDGATKDRDSRSPTDVYLKVKRWSAIFWIVCFVYLLGGVDQTSIKDFKFLGLKISDDNLVPFLVFFVSIYMLYNLIFCWGVQNSVVKNDPFIKADFTAHYVVSLGVVVLCAFKLISSTTNLVDDLTRFISKLIDISDGFISASVIAQLIYLALALSTLLFSVAGVRKIFLLRVQLRNSEERILFDELVSGSWRFYFSPQRTKEASKIVKFSPDGTFAKGGNDNETTWSIQNGILEIMNREGKVFSRFKRDGEAFTHTNDEDTLSLRDQFIEKLEKQ
ncbi:hypothetical protein [Roseibium sp.]|uniref:hypothetical protein n=1 Tax=Roseibium sp. TaxID=1936156 RepID=UPI003A9809C4